MSKILFGFELEKQWDYENGFYITSHLMRLQKLIAHYELYKSISHLPGHIIECGVFKGNSLIRFLIYRDLITKSSKKSIYGFDAFGKFI